MFELNSWHYFKVQCMPNRTATPEVVEVLLCPTRSMGAGECRRPCGALVYIYVIILFFGDSVGLLLVSASVCNSRNWNSRSNIASFERRLREAAQLPLALLYTSRTSTWTRTDADRHKREVAKILHVEEESLRIWLYLDVCSAWMIYKVDIISKFWGGILSSVCFAWRLQGLIERLFVLLDVCRLNEWKT